MASTGFHFTDVGWNIYVQLRWLLPQWRSRTVPRIRNFHQIFKQTQREEYGTREHSLWMQRERTSGGPYSVLLSLWLQPTPTLPDWAYFLLRVNTCLRCVFVGFSMKIWQTLNEVQLWESAVHQRQTELNHNNFHWAEMHCVQVTFAQNMNKFNESIKHTLNAFTLKTAHWPVDAQPFQWVLEHQSSSGIFACVPTGRNSIFQWNLRMITWIRKCHQGLHQHQGGRQSRWYFNLGALSL